MIIKDSIENIIKRRIEKIVDNLDGFISQGEKVLDVGAGGGWIGKEIKERKNAKVTLLDVIDFNQTDLKLLLYDGKKMPFPDNSFDVSLLIFTLHHCQDPLEVLKEAKRVSRKKIVIIEDIPVSWFNKIFLYFWDVITNLPSLVRPPGDNMFFNFKTVSEWQKTFRDFQLKTVSQKIFSSNNLIHHGLFIIQK